MVKFGWRKGSSVMKAVKSIIVVLLGVYVGGQLLNQLAIVMENTTSPLNSGLTLIGWTVDGTGKITKAVGTSGGILTVIGLIGVAGVILTFVTVKF